MPTTPCGPGCTSNQHCVTCHRRSACPKHAKPATNGDWGGAHAPEAARTFAGIPGEAPAIDVTPVPTREQQAAVFADGSRPSAALARVVEAPGALARLAPMRVDQAKAAFAEYQALEEAVLEDDDYIYFVKADVYWVGNQGSERKSAKVETFTVRGAAAARAEVYRTNPGQITRDRVDPLSVVVEARKKKSAFRKMSKAFGLSSPGLDETGKPPTPAVTTEVVGPFLVRKTIAPGFSSTVYMTLKELGIVKAEVQVLICEPNGRAAWQTGSCGIDEKKDGAGGFNHPGHDIEGTAVTRAISRCTSDLIGWGEVSPIDESPLPEDTTDQDRREEAAERPPEPRPVPRGIPATEPPPATISRAAPALPCAAPPKARVAAPPPAPAPSPAPAAVTGPAAPPGERTPSESAAEKRRLLVALMRLADNPDVGAAIDGVMAWRAAERASVGTLTLEDRREAVAELRGALRTLWMQRISTARTAFELRAAVNKKATDTAPARSAALDAAKMGEDGPAWHAEFMVAYTERMAVLERDRPPGPRRPVGDTAPAPPAGDEPPPPDDGDAPPPEDDVDPGDPGEAPARAAPRGRGQTGLPF